MLFFTKHDGSITGEVSGCCKRLHIGKNWNHIAKLNFKGFCSNLTGVPQQVSF